MAAGAAADGASPPPAAAPTLAQNLVAAFNRHDVDGTVSLVTDSFREVFPDGNSIGGKAALHEHLTLEFTAAPHVTMMLQGLAGNDAVAVAQVSIAPDPRDRDAPKYGYVFRVAAGKIMEIDVFDHADDAWRAAGFPVPTPSPSPSPGHTLAIP